MKRTIVSSIVAIATSFGLSATVMANGLDVLTIETKQGGAGISFAGTTDAGMLAVTCGLLDKDGNELAINSVSVESASFSGEFTTGESTGAVAIRCADYDGGEWMTVEFNEDDGNEEEEDETVIPKAPDTGIAR